MTAPRHNHRRTVPSHPHARRPAGAPFRYRVPPQPPDGAAWSGVIAAGAGAGAGAGAAPPPVPPAAIPFPGRITGQLRDALRRHVDLLVNSGSLLATSTVTSLLGFAYWWVAARSFPAAAVGTASAAISAMMLIGTLGMFGMGTLLISELPHAGQRRWNLIASCVTASGTVALIGVIGYVCVALLAVPGLRAGLDSPVLTVLLVLGTVVNAMTLVLDEALIGMLSGTLQLARNSTFAVVKLGLLALLAALPITAGGGAILATWVAGTWVSVALLVRPLRARGLHARVRPGAAALRGLWRNALEHNVLNLALFLPRTTLPLVVTAVLSVNATAEFYTAWMVLTFLAMIPGDLAITLFAVASGNRQALRSKIRMALLVSFGLGGPLSIVVSVAAHPIMAAFGQTYARASGVLSILALTYAATVFRQLFVAVSRVLGRVRRAAGLATAFGLAELAASWYGGSRGELSELAGWLAVVFVLEGILVAPVVLRVAFGRRDT